jgi:hypothetical protein
MTGTLRTAVLRTALVASLPLLAACKTGLTSYQGTHWKGDSVPERITKHFTGYRADLHGRYVDYQYTKKRSINLTLCRHFALNSPDNPFEPSDPSQTAARPPHSLAPDPLYYMGAESIFIGLAILGISGSFVPIPVDSLIATLDGGWGEFGAGFTKGHDGGTPKPPGVSKFRVKNH